MPNSRRSPGIASSSATGISPRSGTRCWCWEGCRPGRARARGSGVVHGRGGGSLPAVVGGAGLRDSAFAAFRVALEVSQEMGYIDSVSVVAALRRRMVERLLTLRDTDVKSAEPLLILL